MRHNQPTQGMEPYEYFVNFSLYEESSAYLLNSITIKLGKKQLIIQYNI